MKDLPSIMSFHTRYICYVEQNWKFTMILDDYDIIFPLTLYYRREFTHEN